MKKTTQILSVALGLWLTCTSSVQAQNFQTFTMEWSGAGFGNAATGMGTITMDISALSGPQPGIQPMAPNISDLSITISGAIAGNGTFTLADFGPSWYFSIGGAGADFTQELIGQANVLGITFFNAIGSPSAPSAPGAFLLGANGGMGDIISLISFAPSTNAAQLSAVNTGLPYGNVMSQMLISGSQTVLSDLNGHLFKLRTNNYQKTNDGSIASSLDEGVELGYGDGPEEKSKHPQMARREPKWEVFTTANYGNVKLGSIGTQAGVQVDAWAAGIGIERRMNHGLTLGFATSFLTSNQSYTNGLGNLQLEGPALSTYVSYVRESLWMDLLYSFGAYSMDTTRNPGGAFPLAFGSTRTYTHSVQYNGGWNFRFQDNTLVTGPFAGIDWLYGTVDGFDERGGGAAALRFSRQNYESLVTRVGWSASKKVQTDWAVVTPQVQLSYERQNLTNNGSSVSLINAPFTANGGNQNPGQDYMVAGAGVNFQFSPSFNMLLSYQGQFFRSNMEAHFGGVRFGYAF